MKNILVIKQRLIDFKNANQVYALIKDSEEVAEFDEEQIKIVEKEALSFLNKLIIHLDSKRPGKSTIGNLMLRCYIRFQHTGTDNKLPAFLLSILATIVNMNFQDAFTNRLNVKSKEFIELPDWDPLMEE